MSNDQTDFGAFLEHTVAADPEVSRSSPLNAIRSSDLAHYDNSDFDLLLDHDLHHRNFLITC